MPMRWLDDNSLQPWRQSAGQHSLQGSQLSLQLRLLGCQSVTGLGCRLQRRLAVRSAHERLMLVQQRYRVVKLTTSRSSSCMGISLRPSGRRNLGLLGCGRLFPQPRAQPRNLRCIDALLTQSMTTTWTIGVMAVPTTWWPGWQADGGLRMASSTLSAAAAMAFSICSAPSCAARSAAASISFTCMDRAGSQEASVENAGRPLLKAHLKAGGSAVHGSQPASHALDFCTDQKQLAKALVDGG